MGAAVQVAGYGQPGPLVRVEPALRSVTTGVVSVADGILTVGTNERTACLGDSGGPVVAGSGENQRVVAIVRGATSAVCASPAEVVATRSDDPWLSGQLGGAEDHGSGAARGIGLALLATCACGLLLARFTARSKS